jgi:hypothetical protein
LGDNRFAGGLDDAGTDEELLAAEVWVAHAFRIPLEVIRFDTQQFGGVD